jgi:hypothetical protein
MGPFFWKNKIFSPEKNLIKKPEKGGERKQGAINRVSFSIKILKKENDL